MRRAGPGKPLHIVGFSNGGMMALRAICSAPETFAAAGSVSGLPTDDPCLGNAPQAVGGLRVNIAS